MNEKRRGCRVCLWLGLVVSSLALATCDSSGNNQSQDDLAWEDVQFTGQDSHVNLEDAERNKGEVSEFDLGEGYIHADGMLDIMQRGCDDSPFGFGCPCSENGECFSGFCVESSLGFVCSTECLEACPSGWQCKGIAGFGSDVVFLSMPFSKKLCYPCTNDAQCSGGTCIDMGGADYCTYDCSQDPCPQGFQCTQTESEEGVSSLCIPVSGYCDCVEDTAGQLRPCQVNNEHGTCYGYEQCDPESGWKDCSAKQPQETPETEPPSPVKDQAEKARTDLEQQKKESSDARRRFFIKDIMGP